MPRVVFIGVTPGVEVRHPAVADGMKAFMFQIDVLLAEVAA
jgi:hypothetical protein